MWKIFAMLSAVAFLGIAVTASARVNHARTSSAHIKAHQTSDTPGSACPSGYATHCPSGDCECFQFFGSVNGNQAGKGTATIQLTVDNGSTERTATPGCRPVYGSMSLAGNKDSAQSVAMDGSLCDGANANSKDPLSGGYGIDGSNASLGGAGTFSGGVKPGGKLELKLSGFIEPLL